MQGHFLTKSLQSLIRIYFDRPEQQCIRNKHVILERSFRNVLNMPFIKKDYVPMCFYDKSQRVHFILVSSAFGFKKLPTLHSFSFLKCFYNQSCFVVFLSIVSSVFYQKIVLFLVFNYLCKKSLYHYHNHCIIDVSQMFRRVTCLVESLIVKLIPLNCKNGNKLSYCRNEDGLVIKRI